MESSETIELAIRNLKFLIPEIEDSIKYIEDNDRWVPLSDDFVNAIYNFKLTDWAEIYLEPKKIKALSAACFLDLDAISEQKPEPLQLRNEVLKALAKEIEETGLGLPRNEEIESFRDSYSSASPEEQKEVTIQVARLYLSSITMLFNCLSLMVHRVTLCQLVQEAKDGSDESLRKAIQIDRTILCLPFVRDRIIKAQFNHDPDFWRKLGYRIMNPNFKGKISYRKMYLVFYILDDLELLGIPHADILQICREVGVFDKNQDGDDVGYLGKKLAEYKRRNNLHSK